MTASGRNSNSDEQSEDNAHCTDIKRLPGFHDEHFPYLVTRTANYINLVDLKNKQSYQMLEDRQPQFDNEFMSLVERANGKLSLVFTSTVKNESMDAVSMLNISSKFLNGLRHFAS